MSKRIYVCLGLFLLGILALEGFAQTLERENKMQKELTGLAQKNNDSPFGVLEFLHWNHAWNNYKYPSREDLEKVIKLIKEAGVGWIRMDFVWGDIEPEPQKFDFNKYDLIVDLLAKNEIKILGILHYSTDWASSCGRWNCPPADTKLFVNYISKVIGRYKDKVKHWEIWNEPDSHIYWATQDGLKGYCSLLKEVYIAAKEVDPECKILNGGLAGGISSVNHLYDNGAKDYFDILNLHIFESPIYADSIKRVLSFFKLARKIMARNGDAQKELWVTEIGCPGVKKGLNVKNWWMGKNPSEPQQAQWLKDAYTQLLRQGYAHKIFWAFFRDCKNHWGNGIDYFGLVRWDYSTKPSFFSYQKCVKEWNKSQ